MGISAKVVADSISPRGVRLTTFVCRYHLFVHNELMTHRIFSRNASSSRAIPVMKMLRSVIDDPAMPVHWGENQKGMQAAGELKGLKRFLARQIWLLARWPAVILVYLLTKLGLHKQIANRLLGPWLYITTVLTATEYGNWFNLRYHPDAQPEMQALAKAMWKALQNSVPVIRKNEKPTDALDHRNWHLPYITEADRLNFSLENLLKMSTARCARVSYLNHEGLTPSLKEDLDLFDRLLAKNPKHASPSEHQAMPCYGAEVPEAYRSNLRGWIQHRKLIQGENMPDFHGPQRVS